jgi:hypothetical protein
MAQYNFRLFLKPTVIGQAIIDRLSPEGADRQALARRWIELGYALEQAGFRLDGTTVFQGARPVSLETPVAVPVPSHWLQPPTAEAVPREARIAEGPVPVHVNPPTSTTQTVAATAPIIAGAGDAAQAPVEPVVRPAPAVVPAAPSAVVRPIPAADEMTDNLRNLSM